MNKFWLSFTISAFFLSALIIFLFVVGFPFVKKGYSKTISPLPDFLTRLKNNQVVSLNFFLPFINANDKEAQRMVISAKSVLIYDFTTERTLYTLNQNKRMPMASLTKIMTAIVALENKKTDDKYLVSKSDLVGENSMGLTPGEILSLEELLYGLILVSGNDAAEVFASNYPGGRSAFVDTMNNKAKSLGLLDTNFTNPSGLEGEGDQHTTAYDLLVMTNYSLLEFPLFRKVVSTFRHDIYTTDSHKAFFLENETNLLTSYPGVKGVKTGYTPDAGLCLVTYLEYSGHKLIGVLLGSNNRRQEMKELLDYSLKELGVTPPQHL